MTALLYGQPYRTPGGVVYGVWQPAHDQAQRSQEADIYFGRLHVIQRQQDGQWAVYVYGGFYGRYTAPAKADRALHAALGERPAPCGLQEVATAAQPPSSPYTSVRYRRWRWPVVATACLMVAGSVLYAPHQFILAVCLWFCVATYWLLDGARVEHAAAQRQAQRGAA